MKYFVDSRFISPVIYFRTMANCFGIKCGVIAGLGSLILGCGGASGPSGGGSGSVGGVSYSIVGAAQAPVSSSAAYGANVIGIAGALVSSMTLNITGPPSIEDSKIAFSSQRDGNDEIYTMRSDGTGAFRVTNNPAPDTFPAWFPDGSKIVFSSTRDGNTEIYSVNADGTNTVRLTNNAATDYLASVSPDGTKIAFNTNRDGNTEIYVMNIDGTGQTRLTNNASTDSAPSWSPDGTKITFMTDRDGNLEIYSMNPDGTNVARLTNNAASDYYPCYSPDGEKICFATQRDAGNFEIYTMNSDGSNPVRITNNAAIDYVPTWSPDGSSLAYQSQRDGNYEIYTTNLNGPQNNATRLTVAQGNDISGTFSKLLPRQPKPLVGIGAPLGASAAGFLVSQSGTVLHTIVVFDTVTPAGRANSRVTTQSAASNDLGTNLIFSFATSDGLASVNFAELSATGIAGTPQIMSIPAGSTAAIISFDSASGLVTSIIPYAANRGTSLKKTLEGDILTFTGEFKGVWNRSNVNLAPNGVTSVQINQKTGELVSFK
jgi:TolB protein